MVTLEKSAEKKIPTRRDARILVMQACYAVIVGELAVIEVYQSLLSEIVNNIRTEAREKQREYTRRLGEIELNAPNEVADNKSGAPMLKSLREYAVTIIELADFITKLFQGTLERRMQYEAMIDACVENRSADRIVPIDRILVMLGMEELLYFPTIPVKVTINEYIEISKEYSTEKSNIFVNGLLDKFYNQFEHEGRVKKEGIGLLQNKRPSPKNFDKKRVFKQHNNTAIPVVEGNDVKSSLKGLGDNATGLTNENKLNNLNSSALQELSVTPALPHKNLIKKRKRLIKEISNE